MVVNHRMRETFNLTYSCGVYAGAANNPCRTTLGNYGMTVVKAILASRAYRYNICAALIKNI